MVVLHASENALQKETSIYTVSTSSLATKAKKRNKTKQNKHEATLIDNIVHDIGDIWTKMTSDI